MLWFITPAHGRFEVTQQTLAQRAKLIRRIGARCVVIAEDENLEIAEALGLDAIFMDNKYLGRRFNAGIQYALDQGATHLTMFDSDSISLDSVYETLEDYPTFHPHYSFLTADGKRGEIRHERWVQTIWPRRFMEAAEGQPCARFIEKHISSSALGNLQRVCKVEGMEWNPQTVYIHPLEQVGFQSEDNISDPYAMMVSSHTARWAKDVWNPLLETYTEDRDQILALKNYYERKSLV